MTQPPGAGGRDDSGADAVDAIPFLPSTSPQILRELAALIESRQPNRAGSPQARRRLSPEALQELADMLELRKRPTVGWWRRHLAEDPEP
jgi:hypothetical protein